MMNISKQSQPVRNFKEWFNKGGDLIEKIVSIVVLVTEIVLLFLHNVEENISFYLFTGLNMCFSFFIWYTFIKRKGNIFYTLDEEFGVTDEYGSFSYEEALKNDPKSEPKEPSLTSDQYRNTFKHEDAVEGNLLIRQFSYIRYSWLFTGCLYVLFIINHALFSDHKDLNLMYLKPWMSCGIILVNLLSTYFYLVGYYVMYYSPLNRPRENNDKKIQDIPQFLHIKRTSWWLGLIVFVLIAYIFSYNYFKPDNKKFANVVLIENDGNRTDYDSIRITGEKNKIISHSKATIINDGEEDETYYIGTTQKIATPKNLYITVDRFQKNTITLVDTIHTHFFVNSLNDKSQKGKLIIQAGRKNAKLHFDAQAHVNKVAFETRDKDENMVRAVDFVFEFGTGLLCALIMCFFVGRFESMTFETPSWVLIILYFYAVIQGFLVIINADYIKENEFLISAHGKISKFVFFIALLGKIVLYTYIIGLFSTKRLFYYFIETNKERKVLSEKWKFAWTNITARKK